MGRFHSTGPNLLDHRDAEDGAALGGLRCFAGPRFALVRAVASASVAVRGSGRRVTEPPAQRLPVGATREFACVALKRAEMRGGNESGRLRAQPDRRAAVVEELVTVENNHV